MQGVFIVAIPAFAMCMALEWAWCARRALMPGYEARDTAASLAMGAGSVVLGLGADALLAMSAQGLLALAPWQVPSTWWGWALAILAVDLAFYWCHRAHHEVRMLWAAHVNHHSSKHFNLSTALRQSWTEPYTSIPFLAPLALLGFSPAQISGAFAINLLYQFLTHTEAIGRLGPLERVLNTPSHHRVHHGSNVRYLDRNYAGILIVWDRLFGTFEAEGERVRYGLVHDIDTFNPLRIASHEWAALLRDVWQRPRHALELAARPPGWRPGDDSQTARRLREALDERAGDETARAGSSGQER